MSSMRGTKKKMMRKKWRNISMTTQPLIYNILVVIYSIYTENTRIA